MRKVKHYLWNKLYILTQFGINPLKLYHTCRGFIPFWRDYFQFRAYRKQSNDWFPSFKLLPSYSDRFDKASAISGHYFYQDLLVANKIFHNKPKKHVDIGSSVTGFVAHVASYREIEFFDVRDLDCKHPNIVVKQADLTHYDKSLDNYCDSISSLHAIEHFGLGRYGDTLDYEGHIKGINNIYKILQEGGKFYFSVPIGPQRIEFNSHRVFSVKYLLELFKDKFKVDTFSYIDDRGEAHPDVALEDDKIDNSYGCNFGCGIFELTKLRSQS